MNSGISNYDINNQLEEFIDYIHLFYGADDAIYPLRKIDTDAIVNKNDILIAVHQYLATIRKRNSETYRTGIFTLYIYNTRKYKMYFTFNLNQLY